MKFQYAIFDMDGLMFDTESLFVDSFIQYVAPQTGMEFPREKLVSIIGLNHASTVEVFPKLFGTKYSCDECYAISETWTKRHIAEHGLPVKPGLVRLLAWLRENGFRIAVASSSDRSKVSAYIESVHLTEYFDVVMGGDMVTRGKPDPQIFLMAAEALGCEDPASCVVFEDSKNGLMAGKAAGMNVIIVPDLQDPTELLPGYAFAKVKTLSDAIPVLSDLQM